MRQFDVYRNPSPRSLRRAPFVLVLPDRHLLDLPVTIVAPLVERRSFAPIEILNPLLIVEDQQVILSTLELANISSREPKTHVANLEAERERIIRAINFLFTGI